MTIGPAPMIRIVAMSVRLGIGSHDRARTKKGRASSRPSACADQCKAGARALFRPLYRGREGDAPGLWTVKLAHARFPPPPRDDRPEDAGCACPTLRHRRAEFRVGLKPAERGVLCLF